MADTGAPYFIPYVEPTDLVRDYPAADEASADAIAAALDAIPVLAGIGSNVVSAIRTTTFSTSSTTYTNWVGVDVTITPSSATSKVLVALFCGKAFTGGGGGLPMFMQIGRGTTEIGAEAQMRPDGATIDAFSTLFVLDSPATASAVTYRGRVKVTSSANYLNGGIVAIEVAA